MSATAPRPWPTELVMAPPCRLIEPRLTQPIRRPRSPRSPAFGFVLLLERDQVAPVWAAIRQAARAWPRGLGLLSQRCIADPLRPIPAPQAARWGGVYRNGFYLRVETVRQPPIFGEGNVPVDHADVHPGSLVECALTVEPGLSEVGEREITVGVEWIDARILARPNVARWMTVPAAPELVAS